MKKILKLLSLFVLLIILSACSLETSDKDVKSSPEKAKAEKIEIVKFYSTNQCYSCVYVGNKVFEIVDKKFREEYQTGKIILKDINVDNPKNKDIANKYQARGSSLFFNFIIDGQENISEDANVWRLVGNDQAFENYIIKKINDNLK